MSDDDASRMRRTHVAPDGTPKRVLESEAEAIRYAVDLERRIGRRLDWYECWMRPRHFHVGSAR